MIQRRAIPQVLYIPSDRFDLVEVIQSVDDDIIALTGKSFGNSPAYAAGRSSDQSGFHSRFLLCCVAQ